MNERDKRNEQEQKISTESSSETTLPASSQDDACPEQQHSESNPAASPSEQHETKDELDLEKQRTKDKQYSVFTVPQKRAIIVAASAAGFFSPLTGSIYFPAISTIAAALDTSANNINLTVTTYLIFQGISPMLIAGFSDKVGRRPAYSLCFIIYIIANLALGLNNTYGGLLGLRCLQSAGSSGTIALANGVVADLITSAERGQYIAFASLATVLGPSISPIIGGLIAQNLNWHWIFWFLLIFSVSFAIPFLLFLPESCRKIVDDGSIPPPALNYNISDLRRHSRRRKQGIESDSATVAKLRQNYKLQFPNPLPTLKIILDLESALVLVVTGMGLACFYAISTGASASFRDIYNFSDIQIALMFLPIGAGGIISAFTTGKLVDWNFRRHCKRLGIEIKKGVKMDLTDFPVERARLEVTLPLYLTGMAAVIGYGWMLQAGKISLAGPIIMFLLMGYCLIATQQTLNVLMVDIWPGKAASSTAASNLVRCLLGAAASAAIEPMRVAMGYGWAYSLLALMGAATTPGMLLMMKMGVKWRKRRAEKKQNKAERKQKIAENMGA